MKTFVKRRRGPVKKSPVGRLVGEITLRNPNESTAIRQRRPMTEARLKANRENAKKAALSGRSGRPRGSMDGNRLSLRERCRVRDEEHVATLERIAADDSHPGFQLVAIRDLMDRGWGRPSQMVEG